jgi:RNA polymerase sigma factor (sigma-70 family)
MEFEQIIKEKNYLIKSVMKRLKICSNYEEFYHIGTIALFHAINNYDETKDKYKNFDLYAYYIILNNLRNELTNQTRYSKFITIIDLYENEHLAPIIENDIINNIEWEELFKLLPYDEYKIIKLRQVGYKNSEIASILNITEEHMKPKIPGKLYIGFLI